ncbi:MAG: cytochrome c peroxidase [Myxococcota bacterium]
MLNAHDFTVSEIDITAFFELAQQTEPPTFKTAVRLEHSRDVTFGADPLPERARLGRRIFTYVFNDKISRDHQLACRSCHIDGADDGLVWMVGLGKRQTPALARRLHDTAPSNWVGSEHKLQRNMDRTMGRMGGEGLDEVELESLEEFLLIGLTAPPNPYLRPDGLTDQQVRGQTLFNDPQVGCATCHMGNALTDGRLHDVGTLSSLEHEVAQLAADLNATPIQLPKFDTPSLRGLHASAPYLHDGSASTLYQMLKNTATTMGKTDHPTDTQRHDLVAYLLTL